MKNQRKTFYLLLLIVGSTTWVGSGIGIAPAATRMGAFGQSTSFTGICLLIAMLSGAAILLVLINVRISIFKPPLDIIALTAVFAVSYFVYSIASGAWMAAVGLV